MQLVYYGVIGYTYVILEEPITGIIFDFVKLFIVIHHQFMTAQFLEALLGHGVNTNRTC